MSYPWTDRRLAQAAEAAAEHGCASAVDVESLVAEVRRLLARADELQFCLGQARIVLSHFADNLPDLENRKLAFGALVASDMDDPERMAAVARKALGMNDGH